MKRFVRHLMVIQWIIQLGGSKPATSSHLNVFFRTYGIIVGPESGILINSIAGHGDEHGVGGGSHRVNRWQHVTCVVHQDLRGTRHPIVNLKFEIHSKL